jgi:hypothetical protein
MVVLLMESSIKQTSATVDKGKLQNVLYAEPEILVSARISTFRA